MPHFSNPRNPLRSWDRWTCPVLFVFCGVATSFAQEPQPSGIEPSQSESKQGAGHVLSHDPATGFSLNEQPFTRFQENIGATPFLYPLLAPGQIPVTRGFPMDPHPGEPNDHPHHKSVWVAHGDVDGIDYWTDKGKVHSRGYTIDCTKDQGQLIVRTSLLKDDLRICDVDTAWSFAGNNSFRWIDAEVSISATDREIRFGDTKEGFFALRLHPDLQLVADPKQGVEEVFGKSFNDDGILGAEIWGKQSKWVCYQGPVDGTDVSVVMMDHPGNLRHPTTWHARDYGLVAANPFGLHDFLGKPEGEGDFPVLPGSPLVLRYRILLANGLIDAKSIEAWFQGFSSLPPTGFQPAESGK